MAAVARRGVRRPHATSPVEAQLVEPLGAVARDARGEDVLLPGRRADLEPRSIAIASRNPARPPARRARTEVMTLEQIAQAVLRAHRLDLGAQPIHRVPVDAREEAPIAELVLVPRPA